MMFAEFEKILSVFLGKNKYICNMNKRTITTMLPKIQDVLKEQPVVRAWIFGSYSRGVEIKNEAPN